MHIHKTTFFDHENICVNTIFEMIQCIVYIEENRYFSNGGSNLHIHAIAQGRPEDNQVEFLQGPHGIVNLPKNLVLNNIRRFT